MRQLNFVLNFFPNVGLTYTLLISSIFTFYKCMQVVEEMKLWMNYSEQKWMSLRNKLSECLLKNAEVEEISCPDNVSL